MNRNFWLFVIAICTVINAEAQGFSVLGGVTKFGGPDDGTYWNVNQQRDFKQSSKAVGLRWDSERSGKYSFAVQYTHFGSTTIDAFAVLSDAPTLGGYIPDSGGQCQGGTCLGLGRWVMRSTAQSVAVIGVRHFGSFGAELGLNLYETKTTGMMEPPSLDYFHYHSQRYLSTDLVVGLSYKRGPWSVRWQAWFLDGPVNTSNEREAPAIMNGKITQTLLVGYQF